MTGLEAKKKKAGGELYRLILNLRATGGETPQEEADYAIAAIVAAAKEQLLHDIAQKKPEVIEAFRSLGLFA